MRTTHHAAGLIVVAFDPSSTRTGYAVARVSTAGESLVERGSFRCTGGRNVPPERRLAELARDCTGLIADVRRDHGDIAAAGLEVPTPRGNRNINRQGLFTWARAVGVVDACLAIANVPVIPAGVDRWARGKPKEQRAREAALVFPDYRYEDDKGLDEADALGVVLFIAKEARKRAMVNGGDLPRALRDLCATLPAPTSPAPLLATA